MKQRPRSCYGGTLRVAQMFEGASVGYPPELTRAATSQRQASPAIETLLRIDKAGKLIPWLATGYKNDAAVRTVSLHLRKGVKFHDGTDFNAEAVKWNLDQCISAHSAGTEKFMSVDVIDDHAVRMSLSDWDSTVTGNLSSTIGMMISPTAYKKNGKEWCANHPVGTGPFRFARWERDVRTVYVKFDGYWQKGKPYLDQIEWIPILDAVARKEMFRKGELDLALDIAAKDLAGLEKDGYVVRRLRVGSGASSLIPDSANPKSPFADVRVREAVAFAINTEAIVKTVYYGETESSNQGIYKGHWGYNPAIVGYPYNPARAKQLLAESGYPNGFKTKLLYRKSYEYELLHAAVQGFLRNVGIDVELDPVEIGRFDQIALQGGKWEGLVHGVYLPNPDLAAGLAMRYSGGGSFFTQMLVPDDYGKAIQNAITAPDFKTKQKYVREAMTLMIDKYCLQVPLYCPSAFAVSQTYLHNHGLLGTPSTALWTPEDAWLERSGLKSNLPSLI